MKMVGCLAALLLAAVAVSVRAIPLAGAEEEKKASVKASEGNDDKAKEEKTKAGEHETKSEAKGEATAGEGAKAHEEKAHKTGEHGAEHPYAEFDNGHANSGKKINDPDEIKGDSTIATLVIFLLLLAILTKFAWKPIAHGLEAREKGIEDKIEQARIAAEKATEQLKAYEARLAAATQEAQQIVGEARKTAETQKEKILAEAQTLAQREREKAVADISTAKNQALREIAEKSVDPAIGLARNIIRREVRPGDHEQLIQDALKQFPNN